MAHAHCMLDPQDYKHPLRICNTYCFSTATLVARTRLSVALYVHCLCCYVLCKYCHLGQVELFPNPSSGLCKQDMNFIL